MASLSELKRRAEEMASGGTAADVQDLARVVSELCRHVKDLKREAEWKQS